MGKAVKTIASVAAVGAGIYYGLSTPGGYGSFGSMLRTAGRFVSSNPIAVGGALMQGASAIQQRKYGKEASNNLQAKTAAENKAIASRNKYNQLLQKRQRLTAIRQARSRQGDVVAAGGNAGLGSGGTSAFSGAVGAIGTQTSANLGNINVAQDVGNQITGLNTMAANYGSAANTATSNQNMWSNYQTLGGTLLTNSTALTQMFNKAKEPESTMGLATSPANISY